MHDVPFRIKSVQKYEQRTSQLRNKGWYFIVAPPLGPTAKMWSDLSPSSAPSDNFHYCVFHYEDFVVRRRSFSGIFT